MLPELPIINIHFGFLYFFFLWDSVGSTKFGTCSFHECNGEKQAAKFDKCRRKRGPGFASYDTAFANELKL